MNPLTNPSDLNAAIDHLEQAARNSEGTKIRAALADHSLSVDQIRESLPEDLSVLLPLLSFKEVYSRYYAAAPEEVRPRLEEARAIVEREFGDFAKHPAIAQRFGDAIAQAIPSPENWPNLAENRQIFIGTEPRWQDEEGKLVPTTRLAFLGPADKTTVVMAADPTDPLLLSGSLLGIAVAEFERCLVMAEKGMLRFPYSELVPDLLNRIDTELKKLRSLAEKLGIDSNPSSDGTSSKTE